VNWIRCLNLNHAQLTVSNWIKRIASFNLTYQITILIQFINIHYITILSLLRKKHNNYLGPTMLNMFITCLNYILNNLNTTKPIQFLIIITPKIL